MPKRGIVVTSKTYREGGGRCCWWEVIISFVSLLSLS